MHARSIGVVGAITVASTSALLIPGDLDAFTAKADDHGFSTLPHFEEQTPKFAGATPQAVQINCAKCPFALASERHGQHEWTSNVPSNLNMNVASNGHNLLLNNVPVYPVNTIDMAPVLQVKQSRKSEDDASAVHMAGYEGDLRLSYGLQMEEKAFKDGQLVTLTMSPMALDGEMIRVDDLRIRAIRAPDGALSLLSAEAIAVESSSLENQCTNVMCRVFSKVIAGVRQAKASAHDASHRVHKLGKSCMKSWTPTVLGSRPGHGVKLSGAGSATRPNGQPFTLHYSHAHSPRMQRFALAVFHVMNAIVLPIMLGIMFGMLASAVGMLVGRIVVFIWTRIRPQRHHDSEHDAEYEPLNMQSGYDGDVKDVPPPYDAPPFAEESEQCLTLREALTEKGVQTSA